MGYEIKTLICDRYRDMTNGFMQVIGTFDLCKVGTSEIEKVNSNVKYQDHNNFFYADDGNTKIDTDRYGEKIRIVPFDVMLKAASKDAKGEYRRFKVFAEFLKTLKKNFEWEVKNKTLVVVLYGH